MISRSVVAVRGSFVDIRFDAHLPPIYSLLHAQEGEVAIEVLAQLDAHRICGVALTPSRKASLAAWRGKTQVAIEGESVRGNG